MATHCITLRHVATRSLQRPVTPCNALCHCTTMHLQHAATCCNMLQHAATHCNALQRTATHCNTLQHTATPYNALQHTATQWSLQIRTLLPAINDGPKGWYKLQNTAAHRNTLQHTATHYHIVLTGDLNPFAGYECWFEGLIQIVLSLGATSLVPGDDDVTCDWYPSRTMMVSHTHRFWVLWPLA